MSSIHCELDVVHEIEKLQIGQVKRIDFTPIHKKPGFDEDVHSFVKSAFVHFHYYYNNENSTRILEKLFCGEGHKINVIITTNPYNNMEHTYEYWTLLKATNPIQETMMNESQIVENCRFLEKKVIEQAEKIKYLERKTDNIQNVVQQLVCGLFSHKTQSGTLNRHLDNLFGDNQNTPDNHPRYNKNTSKWGQMPTTIQGDDIEYRFAALEAQMRENYSELLYNISNKKNEQYEDVDSNIVNSLKFNYDHVEEFDEEDEEYEEDDDDTLVTVNSYESMPEFDYFSYNYKNEDNNSTGSDVSANQRRIINSIQLCGNE
jgi:hypothetical protein